jgi:hypothetical protein
MDALPNSVCHEQPKKGDPAEPRVRPARTPHDPRAAPAPVPMMQAPADDEASSSDDLDWTSDEEGHSGHVGARGEPDAPSVPVPAPPTAEVSMLPDGLAIEGGASQSDLDPHRLPRCSREQDWKGFKFAPVFSQGTQIGWGIKCGRHGAQCKKQIRFGRSTAPTEAFLRALKRWVIEGFTISSQSPTGSVQHIAVDARAFLAHTVSDASLDADLDAARRALSAPDEA